MCTHTHSYTHTHAYTVSVFPPRFARENPLETDYCHQLQIHRNFCFVSSGMKENSSPALRFVELSRLLLTLLPLTHIPHYPLPPPYPSLLDQLINDGSDNLIKENTL